MKFAFLTPEYPTEENNGGIGSFVHKMTELLRDEGHHVEVFVSSTYANELLIHNGIPVHRIQFTDNIFLRTIIYLLNKMPGIRSSLGIPEILDAWKLNRRFEDIEREKLFDVVHSVNYKVTGLFVKQNKTRKHIVRLCSSRLLYEEANRVRIGPYQRLTERLYVYIAKHADRAYAPSEFLARYYRKTYGVNISVLRPPLVSTSYTNNNLQVELPDKYFVHFGSLCYRKGTDIVLQAMEYAIQEDPEIQLILVGKIAQNLQDIMENYLKNNPENMRWIDHLPQEQLFYIIKNAEAAILPSRADNLPNTVIESLTLDTPVIGTQGASIDEIVVDDENGLLVPFDDVEGMKTAILKLWSSNIKHEISKPDMILTMKPEIARNEFIQFTN